MYEWQRKGVTSACQFPAMVAFSAPFMVVVTYALYSCYPCMYGKPLYLLQYRDLPYTHIYDVISLVGTQ